LLFPQMPEGSINSISTKMVVHWFHRKDIISCPFIEMSVSFLSERIVCLMILRRPWVCTRRSWGKYLIKVKFQSRAATPATVIFCSLQILKISGKLYFKGLCPHHASHQKTS
jgi:hypothetical protein